MEGRGAEHPENWGEASCLVPSEVPDRSGGKEASLHTSGAQQVVGIGLESMLRRLKQHLGKAEALQLQRGKANGDGWRCRGRAHGLKEQVLGAYRFLREPHFRTPGFLCCFEC